MAEAITHIRRLQTENRELRARIAELEAAAAMHHGTIAGNRWEGPAQVILVDERYTHNVPPNAPPHGENAE